MKCLRVSLLLALVLVYAGPAAQAQTYSVLYAFRGGKHGTMPSTDLVLGKSGSLFGTNNSTVFRINPLGQETILHSFTGADGNFPIKGVILDKAGNLYGTTGLGGDLTKCDLLGCGVAYKLDKNGVETVLFRFTGGADGANPWALVMDKSGNLYGTTAVGGGRGVRSGLRRGVQAGPVRD